MLSGAAGAHQCRAAHVTVGALGVAVGALGVAVGELGVAVGALGVAEMPSEGASRVHASAIEHGYAVAARAKMLTAAAAVGAPDAAKSFWRDTLTACQLAPACTPRGRPEQ